MDITVLTQWAKSPKKQSVGVYQKGTPSDCFFGDFAHWEPNLYSLKEANPTYPCFVFFIK